MSSRVTVTGESFHRWVKRGLVSKVQTLSGPGPKSPVGARSPSPVAAGCPGGALFPSLFLMSY